jgi:hypothetical protein
MSDKLRSLSLEHSRIVVGEINDKLKFVGH